MIKTRLIRLLSHAGKYIVYHVLWQWLALVCQIVVVFSVAGLLESAAAGTLRQQDLLRTAAVLAAAVLIRFGCDKGAAHASFAASVDVKRILREKIYDKLLRLGASYREQTATSEVVQMAAEGVEQLETYFGRYLPQLFYSLLAPVTLFAVLSFVSLKASVILLICVPLIPVSIVAVQKFAKKLLNRYWGIYTGLGDSFLENLQGLTTLKIYQADGQKAQEMDREAEQFRKITMKVLTMQLNSISVMDIVAYGGADDRGGRRVPVRQTYVCRRADDASACLGIFYSPSPAGIVFSYCNEWNGCQRQDFPASGSAGTGKRSEGDGRSAAEGDV